MLRYLLQLRQWFTSLATLIHHNRRTQHSLQATADTISSQSHHYRPSHTRSHTLFDCQQTLRINNVAILSFLVWDGKGLKRGQGGRILRRRWWWLLWLSRASMEERTSDDHIVVDTDETNSLKRNNNSPCQEYNYFAPIYPRVHLFTLGRRFMNPCSAIHSSLRCLVM